MTETDIEKSCCFTGHRDIPEHLHGDVFTEVCAEIKRLYDIGVRRFIAGGAIGFDMICAKAVLFLKEELDGITLTLALPCKNHDAKWAVSDKIDFFNVLVKADETVYVSEAYSRYCMFKRNRFMVDNSRYCISYCQRESGGSYYTVKYARSLSRETVEISGRVD